jgi:hypothetical protein
MWCAGRQGHRRLQHKAVQPFVHNKIVDAITSQRVGRQLTQRQFDIGRGQALCRHCGELGDEEVQDTRDLNQGRGKAVPLAQTHSTQTTTQAMQSQLPAESTRQTRTRI